jgi:hypothetical protein
MSSIRNELDFLRTKLEELDLGITKQVAEAEIKSKIYCESDTLLSDYVKFNNKIITINVGGKVFQTKLSTLMQFRDSLIYIFFCKCLLKGEDIPSTLFFDRNYTYFPLIMDYIRTGFLNKNNLSRNEKEELENELIYYGLSTSKKYYKDTLINLGWCNNLSKKEACTIDPEDVTMLKVHSTTCYTHFVTDREFTDENVKVEFNLNVTQSDSYFYIGVINENYSLTSNCMCCTPTNAFYLKCDGNTYINGKISNFPNYSWLSQEVLIGFRLYSSSKKLYIYRENEEELGPFNMVGNKFRFVSGHCNTGNGTIQITKSVEINEV